MAVSLHLGEASISMNFRLGAQTVTARSICFFSAILGMASFVTPMARASSILCPVLFRSGVGSEVPSPTVYVAPVATSELVRVDSAPPASGGYRLNSYLLARALEEPSTRKRTWTLFEAARMLEAVTSSDLLKMSEMTDAAPSVLEDFVRVGGGRSLSPEATDLIVSAIREMNRGLSAKSGSALRGSQIGHARVRQYFYRLAQRRQLPELREVLANYPGIFYLLADTIHLSSIAKRDGVETVAPGLSSKNPDVARSTLIASKSIDTSAGEPLRYRIELRDQMIKRLESDAQTFSEWVPLALSVARPELRSTMEAFFYSLLPNPSSKVARQNIDPSWRFFDRNSMREVTWQMTGVNVIDLLSTKIMPDAASALDASRIRDLLKEFLQDDSAPEFQILFEAIVEANRPERDIVRSSQLIRQKIRDHLTAVGETIRHDVKELDAKKRATQVLIAPPSTAPVSPVSLPSKSSLRDGGIRIAAIPGRILKKASTEAEKKEAELRATVKPLAETPVAADVRELNSLHTSPYEPGLRYSFSFHRSREPNFVVIKDSVLADLEKRNLPLGPWVSAFLRGPVGKSGSGGLKKMVSHWKNEVWEIKSLGEGFRIIVQQDKKTKTWIWLGLVPHSRLQQYMNDHRL